MIRINLLAVDRERTKKKSTFLTGQKVTIACSLVLVLAIVAIGWRYLSLKSESKQLDIDIANSQEEATRLHAIILQVQEFEQRKAQLQQRVVLIEQLRKSQTGPVHMLDQIGRSASAVAVAHVAQAGGQRHHDRRSMHVADGAVRFRREPRGHRLLQEVGGDQAPAGTAAEPGAPDVEKFSVKGVFITPGDAAAASKTGVKPAAVKN